MKHFQVGRNGGILLAGFLILMILGGCIGGTSPPTTFYLLNATPGKEYVSRLEKGDHSTILALGPIELPAYLDRPEIIIREGQNKVALAEFNQWAEPLADNLERVLLKNLSDLLAQEHIIILPWRSSSRIQYHVPVEVVRFDSDSEGNAQLDARWAILDNETKELLVTRRSIYSQHAGAEGYEALAAVQSKVLEYLSRDMAKAIQKLRP